MKSKKISVSEMVLKSCMLFSIFTVLQGLQAFEAINRIWMIVVVGGLVLVFCNYHYNLLQFSVLIIAVLLHLVAFSFTEMPFENLNDIVYFCVWILLCLYFAKSKMQIMDIMDRSSGYIRFVLWIWTIIVGVSALLPSSYEDSYFVSFTGSSFRLMPTALIIIALTMYMILQHENRKYYFFLILPVYVMFMGHSRTYFGVILIFLMMYVYMQIKNKRNFYLAMIPLSVIVVLFMAVGAISEKLSASLAGANENFDFWAIFTSGRTMFWKWDIEAFFELPFWQQFVGNGFNFVYDVNGKSFARIWAHNDFLNILMAFGYIGLFIYFWVFFLMLKVYWPKYNRIPPMVKLMFLGAVFFNSMFNMSYTYMCAMISYPLFLCVIDKKYGTENLI